MTLQFKVDAGDLNDALGMVSIVTPRSLLPQGGPSTSGYLFTIGASGDCKVYSEDAKTIVRCPLVITDVEGEGDFVLPAEIISAAKYLEGPLQFSISEQDGTHKVKWGGGGLAADDRVTINPKLAHIEDSRFPAKGGTVRSNEIGIPLLREALSAGKTFLPGTDKEGKLAEERNKVVQIFGSADAQAVPALAKANGYMFVSNGTTAFWFYSDAFQGIDLVVSEAHMGVFESFLARSSGSLRVFYTDSMTFAENDKGQVLGWAHSSNKYTKFSYYATKMESVVLNLHRDVILPRLNLVRALLPKGQDKVRLHYDAKADQITFSILNALSDSSIIPIAAKASMTDGHDFKTPVNIDHMLDIFRGAKASLVEFRVMSVPAKEGQVKDQYMFRTIDEFLMDKDGAIVALGKDKDGEPVVLEGTHLCKLTRYAPSKS